MKIIVGASDIHSRYKWLVPKGDLLVIAGDLTMEGNIGEVSKCLQWMEFLLDHNYFNDIVFTPGNHDFLYEKNLYTARAMITNPNIHCLVHEYKEVQGLKIFGSPYSPRFYDWAFNVDRGDAIKKYWDQIPEGLDILLTHSPPYMHGDLTLARFDNPSEHVGCYDLAEAIKRVKPKVCVCGHIHSDYGHSKLEETEVYNASICTERYYPDNPPWIFEL